MNYVKRTFDVNHSDDDYINETNESIIIDGLASIWDDIAYLVDFTDKQMFFKLRNSDFPWKGVQNSEYTITLGDNSGCF